MRLRRRRHRHCHVTSRLVVNLDGQALCDIPMTDLATMPYWFGDPVFLLGGSAPLKELPGLEVKVVR